MKTIPHFDGNLFRVGQDVLVGKPVDPRSAVAGNFIPRIGLIGLAGKGIYLEVFGLQLGFDTGHAAAVTGKFRHGQTGVIVAKHSIKLFPLNLDIQLFGAGCVVLLLRCIAVKRVVALGIDRLEQSVTAGFIFLGRVVGHGQQPFAFYLPLGKKRNTAILVEIFIHIGVLQIFHVAR